MLPLGASMEHWRAFFAQAESDLWTIIDQAILLAASDFPAEFKHKRCEIAETLFAKRSWPPERSIDATMLSGSVVTNATAYVENGSPHMRSQDVDTLKHVQTSEAEGKVPDTYSRGSDSKASAVDRHVPSHDRRSAEPDTCLGYHNDLKTDTHAHNLHGVDVDHSVQQKVSMIKDKFMDSSNQSEVEILQSLKALKHLEINVQILKATDVGREVTKFRKHSSGPIRILAKQLVRTWKGMVDEWWKSTEDAPALNAGTNQGVGHMGGIDSKFQGNSSSNLTKPSMHLPQQCLLQPAVGPASVGRSNTWCQAGALPSCNDDFSLSGRKLHSEHVREEMGSSRVESDELDRPGTMEKRLELDGYPAESSRCIVTKGSNRGSGSGRPLASIPELKKSIVNNDVGCEHRKDVAEKARRIQNNQGDLSQKNGHGKYLVAHANNQKLLSTDYLQAVERPELMKRRLSNESQHTENAKKQRDLQTSSRAELSKGIFVGTKVPASAKAQYYNASKW